MRDESAVPESGGSPVLGQQQSAQAPTPLGQAIGQQSAWTQHFGNRLSFGSWLEGWLKPIMVVFCCGLVMLEALMFFVFSMIYAVHFLPGASHFTGAPP